MRVRQPCSWERGTHQDTTQSWDFFLFLGLAGPSGTSVPRPREARLHRILILPSCCGPGLLEPHLGLCIVGLESFGNGFCAARGAAAQDLGALLCGHGQP